MSLKSKNIFKATLIHRIETVEHHGSGSYYR